VVGVFFGNLVSTAWRGEEHETPLLARAFLSVLFYEPDLRFMPLIATSKSGRHEMRKRAYGCCVVRGRALSRLLCRLPRVLVR